MTGCAVNGFVSDRFAAVRDIFEANFSEASDVGPDLGASFCATVEGETVVDLWGGWADAQKTRPWERDTIANVYSTTKTMTALTALLLADRGELDFAAPVAKYWPEFAANGKARITVAHVMSHTSGLSGWREPFSGADYYDWDKATHLLAAQAPLWEPGTASGYHPYTFGFLIGEVVRRITGRSLGTVFREEIAEPLDADFWIGLPASEDHRVADLIPSARPANAPEVRLTEIQRNALLDSLPEPDATLTRAWRGAEIPAVNGHGNARSIALIQSIVANGGSVNGKRILSEAGCRRALEQQIQGPDLVMTGIDVRFGLGYGLAPCALFKPVPPNPDTIFWAGGGGSLIVVDLNARATFAFAMNRMRRTLIGDERSFRLIEAMWEAMR